MIIDAHVHTFPDNISGRVISMLGSVPHIMNYSDSTVKDLKRLMDSCGVNYAVNLPVATYGAQVSGLNDYQISMLETYDSLGIIPFGAIHPEFEGFRNELRRIKGAGMKGIKLHPAYQNADIDDIRMMRIIDAASEEGLAVTVHGGIDIGVDTHNYASVKQLLKVVDAVHPEKLIIAHMGGWGTWNEVESDLAGADVYFDTAFSTLDIEPKPGEEGLLRYHHNMERGDFERLCRKHGTDRVLFGTDSPWSDIGSCIGFIESCSFTEAEKNAVLGGNAARLLGIVS